MVKEIIVGKTVWKFIHWGAGRVTVILIDDQNAKSYLLADDVQYMHDFGVCGRLIDKADVNTPGIAFSYLAQSRNLVVGDYLSLWMHSSLGPDAILVGRSFRLSEKDEWNPQ